MIRWLQNYSGIQSIGENIEQTELENLRKEVKKYKKKYEQEDKEMEVSSESDDDISPEEQKKIDEEMKKRQTKKKGNRTSVSAEVYGIHNIKKPVRNEYIPSGFISRSRDTPTVSKKPPCAKFSGRESVIPIRP